MRFGSRPCHPRIELSVAVAAGLLFSCGAEIPKYGAPAFTADPPLTGPLGGLIVTSNNGDDTLSAVDPAGPTLRWRIPVGFIPVELEGPHHLSADPTGRFVYVNLSEAVTGSGGGPHGSHGAGTISGYVIKLDAADGRVAGLVAVDPNPGDNTLAPDGQTLYVTHYDLIRWTNGVRLKDLRMGDSNLAVIDVASMTVTKKVALCPAAHGVRIAKDGRTLYASCGPDEIAVVSLADPQAPVARVSLPGTSEGANCNRCPYALGEAPDGTVWVFSLGTGGGGQGGGSVFVYDPARTPGPGFDPARAITFCGSPVFGAFGPSPDGSAELAYVPEQGKCGDWVRIFTLGQPGQAPKPAGEIALSRQQCLNAHMIVVADGGKTGYLVCEGDHKDAGSLVVLDLEARKVTGSVPIGVFADGLVVVPPQRAP